MLPFLYVYPPGKSISGLVFAANISGKMLPLGGQGSNQAFEDAVVLGLLFDGIHTPAQAQERLKLFDTLRIRRVSRVQILSSTSAGREFQVEVQVRAYTEPGVASEFRHMRIAGAG